MDNEGIDVQPDSIDEGQGAEPSQSDALGELYDLSSVPDEQRPYIEPILQDVQRNVNSKFEQAAEYRKQWQPYEELGVTDVDPTLMEELLSIAEIADNDEALQEWWKGLGDDRGWNESESDLDSEDNFDFENDDDISTDDLKAFQEVIEKAIESKTAPLFEKEREREQQQLLAEADREITSQLDELKDKYGEFDESAVCKLALAYDSDDAIVKGFEDYQGLIKNAQNGVFESKSNQPAPPEGEGSADTTPENIVSFSDAKKAAVARLQGNNKA
jgi:hypothetical protein